jgi:hypothetical protein
LGQCNKLSHRIGLKKKIPKPVRKAKGHEPNHHLLDERYFEEAHHRKSPEMIFFHGGEKLRKHKEMKVKIKLLSIMLCTLGAFHEERSLLSSFEASIAA